MTMAMVEGPKSLSADGQLDTGETANAFKHLQTLEQWSCDKLSRLRSGGRRTPCLRRGIEPQTDQQPSHDRRGHQRGYHGHDHQHAKDAVGNHTQLAAYVDGDQFH